MNRAVDLALVLHAHLPYVREPDCEFLLEECWLFESLAECYLPLLEILERRNVRSRIALMNLVLSPTLSEMMIDPLLIGRFERWLDRRISLLQCEAVHVDVVFQGAVTDLLDRFERSRTYWRDRCSGRPLDRFRNLQEDGVIEILTCGVTHGFLPLMATGASRRAQILGAMNNYEKHFHCKSRGFWLPECGYLPEFEEQLTGEGILYSILDGHDAFGANEMYRFANGLGLFTRDIEAAALVWSREAGYPGDRRYRDFHRDSAYDRDGDYLRRCNGSERVFEALGLKYHRITGEVPLESKDPYDPATASEVAREHAAEFCRYLGERCLENKGDSTPLIVAAFDAELFGHWWFEGITFLNELFRLIESSDAIRLVTLSDQLERGGEARVVSPPGSSWGEGGAFSTWLNDSNDWIYPHLRNAERKLVELARNRAGATGRERRALDQAARELMLAQASDWAFQISSETAPEFAEKKTREHVARFLELLSMIETGSYDENRMSDLESRDNPFSEIDFRLFTP